MSYTYIEGDRLHPSYTSPFMVGTTQYDSVQSFVENGGGDFFTGMMARYNYDHHAREELKATHPYRLMGDGADALERVRRTIIIADQLVREIPLENTHFMAAKLNGVDVSRITLEDTQVVSRPRYCVYEQRRIGDVAVLRVTDITPLRSIYRRKTLEDGYLYFTDREAFIIANTITNSHIETLNALSRTA